MQCLYLGSGRKLPAIWYRAGANHGVCIQNPSTKHMIRHICNFILGVVAVIRPGEYLSPAFGFGFGVGFGGLSRGTAHAPAGIWGVVRG